MSDYHDYNENLAFPPQEIKSQHELSEQGRQSDVLIKAIEKCERLEAENKEIKTRLYNIWLECQKPWKQGDDMALIDRLAYIFHLSSVFKTKELDK